MSERWEFFYHNAGSAYTPGKESQIVGAVLGAIALARAEAWASAVDAVYVWEEDPEGSEVQTESGEFETLPAVTCTLFVQCDRCPQVSILPDTNIDRCALKHWTHARASLCGITESLDTRERDNYRRIIEAELALEVMPS